MIPGVYEAPPKAAQRELWDKWTLILTQWTVSGCDNVHVHAHWNFRQENEGPAMIGKDLSC